MNRVLRAGRRRTGRSLYTIMRKSSAPEGAPSREGAQAPLPIQPRPGTKASDPSRLHFQRTTETLATIISLSFLPLSPPQGYAAGTGGRCSSRWPHTQGERKHRGTSLLSSLRIQDEASSSLSINQLTLKWKQTMNSWQPVDHALGGQKTYFLRRLLTWLLCLEDFVPKENC